MEERRFLNELAERCKKAVENKETYIFYAELKGQEKPVLMVSGNGERILSGIAFMIDNFDVGKVEDRLELIERAVRSINGLPQKDSIKTRTMVNAPAFDEAAVKTVTELTLAEPGKMGELLEFCKKLRDRLFETPGER